MSRREWLWYGVGVICLILSGCVSPAAQQNAAAGEIRVDDAVITTKVKVLLTEDKLVRGRTIQVETRQGVVILRGTVETGAQKQRAEEVVRSVQGVKGVENALQIAGQ
jgi:hyperosmotically inducible protein